MDRKDRKKNRDRDSHSGPELFFVSAQGHIAVLGGNNNPVKHYAATKSDSWSGDGGLFTSYQPARG